ncbi:MAG: FixH family protein [Gammaproteobacteria bacterium]
MRREAPRAVCGTLLLLLTLTACSEWRGGEVVQVDGYQLRIKTTPDPLQVGSAASLTLLLRDAGGQPASGCKVKFRQYMPGMEMSRDSLFVLLTETAAGHYEGQTAKFAMGGDWELAFQFVCQGRPHQFMLKRHLEWVE